MATLEQLDDKLNQVLELKAWLYGKNGFKGDIPEIKTGLKNHEKRIKRTELVIASLIGSGALGGGILGLLKLLEG